MIYCGDCIEILQTLPDQSVHCCVTSPPYYGLRDYGIDGGNEHNRAGYDNFRVEYSDGGFCLIKKWQRFNLCPVDVSVEIVGNIHGGKDEHHDKL